MGKHLTTLFLVALVMFHMSNREVIGDTKLENSPAKNTQMKTIIYQTKHVQPQMLEQLVHKLGLLEHSNHEECFAPRNTGNLFLKLRNSEREKELLSFLNKADVSSPSDKLENMNIRLKIRIILADSSQNPTKGQALSNDLTKVLSQIFGHKSFREIGTNLVVSRVDCSSSMEFKTKDDLNLEILYKIRPREDGKMRMEINIFSAFTTNKVSDGVEIAHGKLNTEIVAETGKEFILGNTQVGGGKSLIYAITLEKD